MQGIALVVIYLGMSMAFEGAEILITIFSMVLGGILGEAFGIEKRLNSLGDRLKAKVGSEEGQFTEGFVFASLIYCVGALAVVGSLESGINNNHEILYTKSLLDGTSAIAFTSSLGIGVMFSAIPVFLYQGSIALLAGSISGFLADEVIAEMTSVGGLLIMAIGLNILNIIEIKIANLLPAILIAGVIANIFL
ncbi:putative membrane protein YdfK [Natranaerofaba carboxydovora]|nr:putative membrane protein YdfK [Natranaerofaba carboxydovora]